jgi:N-acetyl-1-D-myo-inositol-2-amino-2-deoxy-alpha-D-glucopyranoside deacetylase
MSDNTQSPRLDERYLFVHAHPDDESITTGGTIATLVASGASVTVLTCTRGELGEVIPADLQRLLASPEALGAHREVELAAAMNALGVRDHRFLGGPGARWEALPPRRYLDSGMRWGEHGAVALESIGDESLAAAPLPDVAADIAAVIADVGATVVVSYDGNGGYGHPDHVRAHDAARRAADVMGVDFFEIATDGDGPVSIDVSKVAARKRAALAAHRSQLTISGDSFALSNGESQTITTVESFRRVRDEEPEALPFREQTVTTKIVAAVAVLVLGALVGTLMTAVHQSSVTVGEIAVPWGLVVGLAATLALIVGVRILSGTRWLTVLAALGVMGMSTYLAWPTVGGSVVVPANAVGYAWTYGPPVVTLFTLAWPTLRRPAQTPSDRHTAEAQPSGG